MKKPVVKVDFVDESKNPKSNSRRKFIKLSGLAFAGSTLLYACSDDDDFNPQGGENPNEPPVDTTTPPDTTDTGGDGGMDVFDLGGGDLGILNYAYALEQLEAAFYEMVVDGDYFSGADENEQQIFTDLRNHEVIHREFFRTAISGATEENPDAMLPDLEFDFSSIDFNSRDSVLSNAQLLEDTGVSAYNGAGNRIANVDYLLLAGKIVSVEARHASAIRNLIMPGTANFAADDVLTSIGDSGVAYDKAQAPSDILAAVTSLNIIQTDFTANNLPGEDA